MKILARLQNVSDPVEITSIDFKKRTFTWDFRGHLENIESFDDAEFISPVNASLMNTIESLQERLSEGESLVLEGLGIIESQKEEIERYKSNVMGIPLLAELKNDNESLKAITELAKGCLTWYADEGNYYNHAVESDDGQFARDCISEIVKLNTAATSLS